MKREKKREMMVCFAVHSSTDRFPRAQDYKEERERDDGILYPSFQHISFPTSAGLKVKERDRAKNDGML